MSSYQSIEIKKDALSNLKEKKQTSWKNLVLLGLVVFAGIVLVSSYSAEKQNNEMEMGMGMDELIVAQDENTEELSFVPYGFQSFATDMENVDLTDMSQILATLVKHGALDISDFGTSTARSDAVRRALTEIIGKLNAEKAAVRNDYNKREQERLVVKGKANKAAADANTVQLAKKQAYDNLQKVANDAIATYNKENAEDKKETDQLVTDLSVVIAQVNRLAGYVPNIHCQVDEQTDFTVSGWSVSRGYTPRKVHGYFDYRSKVVGKTFTGLKSTTGKVQISFRIVYAHTPDNEPIFVNVNGQRKYNNNANTGAPALPPAEKNGYYPGLTGGAWYRSVSIIFDVPANGQVRVDIGVLLNQGWTDEGWFFDQFKICDYAEPKF